MEFLLMAVLVLGALAWFVKISGLKKVVIEFNDEDKPPKQLYR